MKKIALVRGQNLNEWDMQNFYPLQEQFNFDAFCATNNRFPTENINIPVRRLLCPSILPKTIRLWRRLLGDSEYLVGLEKELADFDLVHTTETHYAYTWQAVQAKRRNHNMKVAVTIWENIPFNYEWSRRAKFIQKAVRTEADIFLPVTERARRMLQIEGIAENKIRVLRPGIDLKRFQPQVKNKKLLELLGLQPSNLIVLFVGRITKSKGILSLLFAYHMLVNDAMYKDKSLRFLFVGKQDCTLNMPMLIKRLGLHENVIMKDSVPYEDIPKVHNLADIFVLPSISTPDWQEQFGMVLAESMACAKPVVAALSGSIPEVVGDAGVLVQPDDAYSLSMALQDLILDKQKRQILSDKAYKRAKALFSVETSSARIAEIYWELLT